MKYIFSTKTPKRYQFPTHINDLIMDRSEANTSEVFIVVLEPGQAPPLHKHDDTEQVFYIINGTGILKIGEKPESHSIKSGDVVRIPAHTLHSIECTGNQELRYLAVDCFMGGRPKNEPTWDSHVKGVCQSLGWKYEDVTR